MAGDVYCRGKGDNHRLGHGSEEHVRYPRLAESLQGKRVVEVSVGSTHCVAFTDKVSKRIVICRIE